jgi:DNA-binding NarL/FixJ family response regulator
MRFLVADDHPVVRKGVCSMLASYEGVCIEAADGQEAVEKCAEMKPDLIILDITMPRLDGFSAARKIRSLLPETPILMLSMHDGTEITRVARLVGAQGFLNKNEVGRVLVNAVDVLLAGGSYFPENRNAEALKAASDAGILSVNSGIVGFSILCR